MVISGLVILIKNTVNLDIKRSIWAYIGYFGNYSEEYSKIFSFEKNENLFKSNSQVILVKFNFTKLFLISPRYFRYHQDNFDFTKIILISPR